MSKEITLVDRGRGVQLSTSRSTVHDLVPGGVAGSGRGVAGSAGSRGRAR